jgi:hypothetical protein
MVRRLGDVELVEFARATEGQAQHRCDGEGPYGQKRTVVSHESGGWGARASVSMVRSADVLWMRVYERPTGTGSPALARTTTN